MGEGCHGRYFNGDLCINILTRAIVCVENYFMIISGCCFFCIRIM